MSVPFLLFLGIYLFGVLCIFIYAGINLLHAMRFGHMSNQSIAITFIFIAGLLFIVFMSYHNLAKLDWQGSIDFGLQIQNTFQEFNPL